MKIGILASHVIQYQAPLFRELCRHADVKVYFAHNQTADGQAASGFNVSFEWDVNLLDGYDYAFLKNQSSRPGVDSFFECDTPDIADEIRQGRFDAFLVMGWYLKSYWQAIRACHKYSVPVMVRGDSQLGTSRGYLKQLCKEIIYPLVLRQFDALLYVGQRNMEYLQYYKVSREKMFFSPHCIDNKAFALCAHKARHEQSLKHTEITSSQKSVLFVGKFLDRKRPLDLIEALSILRIRGLDVCGVFVGDGPLKNLIQSEAKARDLPTVFLGFLNQSELPSAYASADVMVLPSDGSETWGLVVNEALACGIPVVVSDAVGCAPDLVIEGQTGARYPVGDVVALADAISRALAVPMFSPFIADRVDTYSVEMAANGVLSAVSWLKVLNKEKNTESMISK